MRYFILHERKGNVDIRSLSLVNVERCSRSSTIGGFESDSSKGLVSGCCADVKRGSGGNQLWLKRPTQRKGRWQEVKR
jgi:hypothetical protein